jgi:hypothetical protein
MCCSLRWVYCRERSGVILEIATDAPGFATDETVETLERALQLPGWLEPRRADSVRARQHWSQWRKHQCHSRRVRTAGDHTGLSFGFA